MSKRPTERDGDNGRADDELVPDEDVEEARPGNGSADETAEAAADKTQAEIAGLKEQLLRLAADFDNYRKRARKEQEEIRRYGIESVLQDLVPVLDNLERALAHGEGDKNPVVQGVRMVAKQFTDVLARFGVQSFSSLGEAFDPERHEAVGQEASEDAPGTVISEMQKGYMLGERLLRPARVVVAMAAPEREDTAASQGD